MATTLQQIVDTARVPLNDAAKIRYPDPILLGHANKGLKVLRARRPDLFFGQLSAPWVDKALTDNSPVPAEYDPVLADFVTAMAESIDDEHVVSGRAASFYALFKEAVYGI